MLQNINAFYGAQLGATDGDIGHVKDFYFDDKTWAIRYLVADTGSWLTGRQVLLSPHAFAPGIFSTFDPATRTMATILTRQQIEASPSIDAHRPVSRQQEIQYYSYFGWPAYWQDFGIGVVAGIPAVKLPPVSGASLHHGHNQRDDLHLCSMKAVTSYHIEATDGRIGTVSSFMVHGHSWAIHEVMVETGHWYAGKPILLLPENITRISHDDSTLFVNLAKVDFALTAKNDIAQAGAGSH